MDTDKPPKKRADAAEVARRVDEVLRLLLDGAAHHDVVTYASEKGWGVNDRQVRTYIQRADALLVERLDKKRKPVIARGVAQRQALFARAINAADYRTALAVLADLAKLRGLYPDPKELKDLVKVAGTLAAKVEELERRLENASRPTEGENPQNCPEAGPSGRADTRPAGGTAGSVPG